MPFCVYIKVEIVMSSLNLEFGFDVPRRVIYEALVDQM